MRNELMKTDPLHAMERATRFDRFLDRFFGDWDRNWPDFRNAMTWNPSIDLEENDDTITVRADIPGVKPEDLRVTIEDNVLHIEGERKEEEQKQEGKSHYVERFAGTFSRSIQLPAHVNAEELQAQYHDGVLEVTCPVEETAKPRQITVQAN
jgi:HSP20 family protein